MVLILNLTTVSCYIYTQRITMKYLALLLSFTIMFSCGSAKKKEQRAQRAKSQEIIQNAKRLIVIVSDPVNKSGDKTYDTIADISSTIYTSRLVETDTVRVIERQRLKDILDELNLSMTGLIDASNMKNAGHVLGADATVFIELSSVNYTSNSTKLGNKERVTEFIAIGVTARIVDVETGEILASTSTTNQAKNKYTKLGDLVKTDSPIDKLDFVKRSLAKDASCLCDGLAKQIKKYYLRRDSSGK